jgi:hypothetical protein
LKNSSKSTPTKNKTTFSSLSSEIGSGCKDSSSMVRNRIREIIGDNKKTYFNLSSLASDNKEKQPLVITKIY